MRGLPPIRIGGARICISIPARGRPDPRKHGQSRRPVDFTGYWVAFVTEDWRFRMVTPRKGDYRNVPMTQEAHKVADAWDPAADEASGNQCRSYGAGAIMRLAARFHITWQDDNTLRVESDAGEQTRLFHFNSPPSRPAERTWQGFSKAHLGDTVLVEGSNHQPALRISSKEWRSL